MMSTPTVQSWWEDDVVMERSGHPPLHTEFKSILHTNGSLIFFISLQLIFSIFLHTTSQKPPISGYVLSYISRFAKHREPHSIIIYLIILFFMSLFKLLLNNSFLWLKAFLAIGTNPCLDFCLTSTIACDEGS